MVLVDGWSRLAPAAVWRWRLQGLVWASLVAVAGAIGVWMWALGANAPPIDALDAVARVKSAARAAMQVGFALFGLGGALTLGIARARYRTWGYRLRDDALVLRRGVLWRATSVVPFARIQHVDTRRGPVDRWLGLTGVVVYTAGVTGGSLELPGLERAAAAVLRDRLVALTGADDAV